MSADRAAIAEPDGNNRRPRALVLSLSGLAVAIYAVLGLAGDLRQQPFLLLAGYALLLLLMAAARAASRRGAAEAAIVLAAALVFRIVAALGAPALSDDVYRYVWDGRVQLHGSSPYRFAPDDPALDPLRDANWERINHPRLPTVYPPLAETLFLALAALGAGPVGFKLGLGLLDFGVVLALGRLLGTLGLPRDRVVLYAWNPLAVLETAGSGHVEPLGIALTLLAATWISADRPKRAALALGAAVQAKLLPLLLVPGYVRRMRTPAVLLLLAVLGASALPYALGGPVAGAGLTAYAARWEHNAFAFAGVRGLLAVSDSGEALKPAVAALEERLGPRLLDWDAVYRALWPGPLARGIVAALLLLWILVLTFKRGLDASRETFLVLAGALLLSPTVHPWYVLWVLPFAAAYVSLPWLCFAALVVLSYVAGPGEVPWAIRLVEYVPLVALLVWETARGERGSRRRQPAAV